MTHLLHLLIVAAYALGPPAAIAYAVRRRRRNAVHLRRVQRAIVGGALVGVTVCTAYAVADGARPEFSQMAVTAYWATSFVLLLGVVDRWLWRAVQHTLGLDNPATAGRAVWQRVFAAVWLRAIVVGAVVIPYVVAVALTYRPRMSPTTDPERLAGWAYEPVTFPAADGSRVAGWWVPADGRATDRTVLLCPGATGGMAGVLPLAADLHADGYNVLTFDFRGHGDSGGQLVSYGSLERLDVLGAVRWLRSDRPAASRRIVGLGVTTGAAALLSAAADPSPDGQLIQAVAVYAPFDRVGRTAAAVVRPFAPPPLAWLVGHVVVPMAGAQVGAPLASYDPAAAAAELWPRPLLVVHGMDDEVVPFAAGQAVFAAASEPKQSLFVVGGRHNDVLANREVRRIVREYFNRARPVI